MFELKVLLEIVALENFFRAVRTSKMRLVAEVDHLVVVVQLGDGVQEFAALGADVSGRDVIRFPMADVDGLVLSKVTDFIEMIVFRLPHC